MLASQRTALATIVLGTAVLPHTSGPPQVVVALAGCCALVALVRAPVRLARPPATSFAALSLSSTLLSLSICWAVL